MKRIREAAALIVVMILGLAPRLAFITRFPTIPFSDFHSLVAFGLYLRDHGLVSNGWFWEYLNPGLPLILCGLFHIFPGLDAATLARLATASVCGVLPVVPFLIWRGVLPLWVRLAAGASLALWPGQILFSGVVAQDNWVLLPSVALGALAVRVLLGGREGGQPVIAGLLYAAGVAIRQEMLIALIPLFVAAAGLWGGRLWGAAGLQGKKETDDEGASGLRGKRGTDDEGAASLRGKRGTDDGETGLQDKRTDPKRRSPVLLALIAAGVPLVGLAAYRGAATGHFTLSTEHTGPSILGAYVPGANSYGWTDPYPYFAAVRPDLLSESKIRPSQAAILAFHEVLRRPGFQAARILSSVATAAVSGEGANLHWSVEAPEVLPAGLRERGASLYGSLLRPLRWEMEAIQGLFLAAVFIGVRRRNPAILVLASSVVLKFGLHAVTAVQGRYLLVATALEILAIVVAAYEVRAVWVAGQGRLPVQALAAGAVFSWVLIVLAPQLAGFVQRRDTDQRTYRFPLESADRGARLACVVDRGVLVALSVTGPQSAAIRTLQPDPARGDAAVATCELTGSGEARPLQLQVFDPYSPGGWGGRMVQRVELDGAEVMSHDIAQEPGSGWADIPLGNVGMGTRRKVVIEVRAINPEPGWAWGDAARTTFQIARPDTGR